MNYRHAFHAGNFADVVKHVALVAVILRLRRKEKPFSVIDTHAGGGLYDLRGPEAARTGESVRGIGRLAGMAGEAAMPEALRVFLECVEREGEGHYPGSSRLAARLMRPQDRLVAIEKHPEEAAGLRAALAEVPQARAVEGDGYERLPALLPLRERRGVVLIDPPYEDADEFAGAADLLAGAHRRFATGIFLLWYPIKSRSAADALLGEARLRCPGEMLRLEIDVGTDSARERLSAAGLLVVNPPYGFEAEMASAAAALAPRLGCIADRPASITLLR
jgi:23S rRNA (adenine2030-N6)-methyltransferase